MNLWRWLSNNHQTLTGIGAMLVGIAALYVAWDQGRVMRDQQHGSAFPVLQVDGFVSTSLEDASMGIRVANNGVGPALIESVTLYEHGEERAGMTSYLATMPAGHNISWSSMTGRALAPGTDVMPIRIRWDRADISAQEIQAAALAWNAWELRVCYCSVFGRCWETSPVGGARAHRVAMCVRDEDDVFENLGATRQDVEGATP